MKYRFSVVTAVVALLLATVLLESATRAGPDGKKLFTEKGCVACHAVGGPSQGPGPELTQVTFHRDQEWIHHWLTDPQTIKKGTVMPKFKWKSPEEQDAIINYLTSVRHPIPAADSSDGAKLFLDYNCGACHSVHKKGGQPQFPD